MVLDMELVILEEFIKVLSVLVAWIRQIYNQVW